MFIIITAEFSDAARLVFNSILGQERAIMSILSTDLDIGLLISLG